MNFGMLSKPHYEVWLGCSWHARGSKKSNKGLLSFVADEKLLPTRGLRETISLERERVILTVIRQWDVGQPNAPEDLRLAEQSAVYHQLSRRILRSLRDTNKPF